LCKKFASLLLVPLFFILFSATVSRAQGIATYPTLPSSYSSIRVFDNKGRFVGRILPEKRYWVSIDRIPIFLQDAVVAVEDARFYEHSGIDFRGIARALVKDVVKGRMAEGGSTITQQLIKNKYLSSEKTFDRKIQEGRMALEFEKKYSKKQILEMYFNEIYYGNGAWGIAQAARLYFDKRPEELSDAECAMLAGVQKSPGRYNPLGESKFVMARRDVVLQRMVDLSLITPAQQQNLRMHPPRVMQLGQAPYYVNHIRNKLIEHYGPGIVEQGGLDVISAMDLNLQTLAEKALREGAKKISPKLQGALVCMDTATGDVLAAVGGVDYAKSNYNRAFFAKRQPGSSMKPLIYAAALEKGISPSSIWNDAPVAYGMWKPQNFQGEHFGDLSLRQALAHSDNVVAVKLLDTVGVPEFVTFARKIGLTLPPPNDLSMALGTQEVTLTDMVEAYSPLANGGMRAEARTIVRVLDRNRRQWTETPAAVTPVLAPATAYVATEMLKDVMVYGTAKNLKKFSQSHPSAGKTGTTSDYRDAWFIGYTPRVVTGVWLGYDKPKPGGKGFTGGAAAAPIWGRFMKSAVAARPAGDFPRPDGVVTAVIDPTTGYLAAPDCPKKVNENFIAGTEPTQYCPKHGGEAMPAVQRAVPAQPGMPQPLDRQQLQQQQPQVQPQAEPGVQPEQGDTQEQPGGAVEEGEGPPAPL